jgi:hypothetical protein
MPIAATHKQRRRLKAVIPYSHTDFDSTQAKKPIRRAAGLETCDTADLEVCATILFERTRLSIGLGLGFNWGNE